MPDQPVSAPIVPVVLGDLRFDIEVHTAYDRYITADIAQHGVWEPFETSVFRALCEPGGFVVDIGANIGWYSLIASACVGSGGRVVALEPEDRNYRLLVRNLARNAATNVDARRVAAGAHIGTRPLFLSTENRGDHRLFAGEEVRATETIEVVTLDALLAESPIAPTLVKCDTQGSEWAVVQGVEVARINCARCAWIMEFWPYGLNGMGARPDDLVRWFASAGYRFFEVSEGNPRLVPTTPDALMQRVATDLTVTSQMFINVLLIHPADPRWPKLGAFQ